MTITWNALCRVFPNKLKGERRKLKTKLLALLVTMIFAISLLPPVISYVPPDYPQPEPEIAVKIEDDWHHTLGPDWDYCMDLPNDTWFYPYEMTAPAVCTTFKVEVWLLDVVDIYAYEFRLAWDWCWLELQSWTVYDLPGPEGLTAEADIFDAVEATPEVEPVYVQIWTFLGNLTEDETFSGSTAVVELTFHVIQDPTWDDSFYSLFWIFFAQASDHCGEEVELTVEHAVAKLNSTPPVIVKELEKNKTWVVGEQIELDINIYNATKLKSFEFLLDFPDWLEVDLQKHPIEIGDFLPPPYEEMHIVVGPSINFEFVCPNQVWIKVIRDCEKDPVSGDGTLVTITFTVLNPFLPEKLGPDYTYCEPQHAWVPETVVDLICFKEAETPMGYSFYEDEVWIDGIYCYQYTTHKDNATGLWITLLAPPFGPPCMQGFYWDRVVVPKVGIEFMPIPADGNLDGHVGLLDMAMGVPFYGVYTVDHVTYRDILTDAIVELTAEEEAMWELCDMHDDDGSLRGYEIVDLFDLVVMAKNWCSTEPPKDP